MDEHGRKQPRSRGMGLLRLLIILFGATAVFLVVGVIVLALVFFGPPSQQETIDAAVAMARLADLPYSATSIEVDGTSNMFSGSCFVRFQAASADIEAFVAQSPSLNTITPELFSPEHMCLPYSSTTPSDDRHYYYWPDDRYRWFAPTVRGQGRRFVIPMDEDACHGEVIINDETNTVFIQAHHS